MRRFATLIIAAGMLLVAGGLLLLGNNPDSSGDPTAVEEALRPQTTSPTPTTLLPAPTPTTTPIPATGPSPPPADEKPLADPIGLRIDALGVSAPIGAYGVDEQTGQMAVPNNVTEVGWYRHGPKPGEPGSAVLAAHVDMAGLGRGVFFELDSLEKGELITVTYADGSRADFRVIARTLYLKDELPLDAIFSRQGPSVLTLITCGGDFNRSIGRYDSNVVVYAIPVTGGQLHDGSTLSGDE